MKKSLILLTALLLTALLLTALLCAAPVAADAVTHNGKTYTTYDQIYASTTLSSSEKLALVQEMAGWTEELAAYMEWKNSGGLEAYQAAVSGNSTNSTSSDYGWNEAPGDGLGDGGTNIEPEYSYQERQAYDAAYEAYQAEFAENYAATVAYTGNGSGTEADPYIITTPAELQSMQDDLNAYYQLGNDIDMSGYSWSPIGTSSAPFAGTLDGNGHIISNLHIINNVNDYWGIFGTITSATIKNTKFLAFNIVASSSSYSHAAVIATTATGNNIIDSCVIEDSIISGSRFVSGFIAFLSGSGSCSISNCIIYNTDITISAIASAVDLNKLSCFASAHANGKITIINSAVIGGDLTKTSSNPAIMGGLSCGGSATSNPTITVSNSVNLLSSMPYGSYSARIGASYTGNVLSFSNVYAANTLTGYSPIGTTTKNGADIDAATAATRTFYEDTLGWDFVNTWYWDSETNTPQLLIFRTSVPPIISAISATPSIGGQQDTYTLSVTATTEAAGGIASYQWYGRIGSSGEWQAISDGTTATYQFVPGAYALGDFYFKCVVTGADGGVIDSYDAGFVNVKITVVLAPQITSPAATPASGPLTQTITLSADVTSSETATYQWQELIGSTWTNISGATAATATVNIADSAATTHSYRLLATNVGGTTTSATVTYTSVAPPTISGATANPTTGPLTQSVTLSASVSGATSYQWQQLSGSTWQNIAGATSATYTANIADSAATTHSYRLLATNVGGTSTSATVTYTSVVPPTINTVSATPASGPLTQTVTLTVSATGAAQYQWQQLTGTTWNNINGATASTHTVSISDNAPTLHSYRVIVSNVGGSITSDTVTYQSSTGPIISTISATPTSGPLTQTVQLSVTATSTNTISYQWQELIGNAWVAISGATTPTYSVSITDTNPTTHRYRVLATDIGGTTPSETITYTSIAPPNIQAVNINPAVGKYTETITLSAEVSGADTYQWQQQSGSTWNNISGATTVPWIGTLTVTGDTQYRLLATNAGGTTTSQTIQYTIAGPANIQSLTATPSVVALPGSTTLTATGSNVISWEWQQYTSGVWTPIGYSASVTERFTDAGTYQFRVLATGADGAVVTSETVEVIAGFAPSVSITSPNDGTRYQSGERIPLTATITGTDPTWEWSFGSQDVQTGGNSQTTWVEYGIDGRYTISIRVVSLFGTDEDSITIISGRESRPIATTPPIELESDGIFEATDSLTPNENGMPDITGFIMSMSKPFTDMIGAWFYFVLFAVPYLIIWIRQKNIIIPSILGVLFAAWVLIQLPAAALPAAIALITLSVTGGLYGIYVKLQNR